VTSGPGLRDNGVMAAYVPLPMPHDMPARWPGEPIAEQASVSPGFADLLLSRRSLARVLVLPRAVDVTDEADHRSSPQAPYLDLDLMAMEDLRRAGVDIAPLHERGERVLVREFSAEVVVALGIFIGNALADHEIVAMYEYLKASIADAIRERKGRGRDDVAVVLNVDVLSVEKTAKGLVVTATGIRGPADQTADLCIRIIREANSKLP
jgi:hypothetical protein